MFTELSTHDLGGVAVGQEELRAMQGGEFILHARGGQVEKVPVEKVRLPRDPKGHVQTLGLALTENGTIYASQASIVSKSTDGGKTWKHHEGDSSKLPFLQIDDEGRFLKIRQEKPSEQPALWASADEGITWERMSEIDVSPLDAVWAGHSMTRLSDGTLIAPIESHEARVSEDYSVVLSGQNTLYAFISKDGGRTFPQRSVVGDWCSVETNIAGLPSGKLLAVIRHQRPPLPDDPPDIRTRTGAPESGGVFKHVFLADSADGGMTWTNLRQLTTVFGQCYGAGVGLSKDRVVVVHDHRYPREVASGRAMVSLDGGQTWEDEVYYLAHGYAGAGYAQTITLDGEEMLTLLGSSYVGEKGEEMEWVSNIGKSSFVIIRWKLS